LRRSLVVSRVITYRVYSAYRFDPGEVYSKLRMMNMKRPPLGKVLSPAHRVQLTTRFGGTFHVFPL